MIDWVTLVSVVLASAGTFLTIRYNYKQSIKNLKLDIARVKNEEKGTAQVTFDTLMNRYDEDNKRLREDIDKLDKALNEERKQRELLNTRILLMESINYDLPIPHWVKDNQGVILQMNKACYDSFIKPSGIPFEKVKGLTDYDFFDKETADMITLQDNNVRRTKEAHRSEEVLNIGDVVETWQVLRWAILVSEEVVANGGIAYQKIKDEN